MHTYDWESDSCECFYCQNKRHVINDAIDYTKEIVKRLYIAEFTDITQIEIALDNLCQCLGVKTIDADIQIQKNNTNWLGQWIDENNLYLNSLKKQTIQPGE